MTGVTAAVMAGGALLSTGAGLYSSGQQQGIQQQGLNAAQANAAQQQQLQNAMLQRQYQLATAGQTDVRGNQLIYDPTTNSWKTMLSPEGQALLARSDAINRMHDVNTLGRGASELSANYQRRIAEGSAASPLLDQIRYGYGAPTREGVVGANKVAAATGASEAGDLARSGYTAAALRTGTGAVPLEQTLASIDRGATSGIRSGLASVDANRNLYDTALSNFQSGKANLYNALATRASNTENIPFTPSDIPQTMDTATLNRAVRGPSSTMNPYAGSAMNTANEQLIKSIGGQTPTNYGAAIGNVTDAFKNWYTKNYPASSGPSGPSGPYIPDPAATSNPATWTGGF